MLEAGAGGAADHGDHQVAAQGRVALEQHRHRVQQHVGSLERLDAPAKSPRARPRQPEPGPRRGLADWPEHVEVHARCTTSTLVGSASYRLTCLASMSVFAMSMSEASTTCSSPITRAIGLGVSPIASAAFLTFAIVCIECASGTLHRSRTSADLAGEPVAAVHEVVPALLVTGLGAQHLPRERASRPGSSPLLSPSNGPAWTWCTWTPGTASTTGGRCEDVARV